MRGLTLVLCLGLLGACTAAPGSDWQSPLHQDHPLVGRIWDRANQAFIDPETLLEVLSHQRYVLLGEKHDNPDQHALQQRILDGMLQRNAVVGVVFEMLDSEQAPAALSLDQSPTADLAALRQRLTWDDAGWEWEFYGPLIHRSWAARVPVRAGNLSRSEVREVYAQEPDARLAAALGTDALARLNQEIDDSHCGQLPESQFPAMVRVQQSRDLRMAEALADLPDGGARLLIAGNFHIRRDLGVPRYLAALGVSDGTDLTSVALLEVVPGERDPNAYLVGEGEAFAYDYVWFTSVLTEEDYCAAFL